MLKPFFGQTTDEIIEQIIEMDYQRYRANQILDWVYKKGVTNLNHMTNVPEKMRQELSGFYDISLPQIISCLESKDGTRKYSLKLTDEHIIEMVIIPSESKTTLCISSQVGCGRVCVFCATGKMGLARNLSAHEIVGQIVLAANLVRPKRITNLVFMGMGEPLDNLTEVLQCLGVIQSDRCLCISPRRTTISTCGVVPKIIELAKSGYKTKLAVSLNSAIDEKRSEIMPINKIYPLLELKKALRYFRDQTSYRITFEYIMIPSFNMDKKDAIELKKFTQDLSCKINLIPWNHVEGLSYKAPTDVQVEDFVAMTKIINQAVTLRKSRGADVNGACGQLASNSQLLSNKHKDSVT